jgi:hypothetical protein
MMKCTGNFNFLLLLSVVCMCTNLPPDDLQMIDFVSAPNPPVLTSIEAGDGSVTVYWNTVGDATSYNLYYKADTTVDKASGISKNDVTSGYIVTNLTNGTRYTFAVTAISAAGESELSENRPTAIPRATSIAPSITTPPQSQSITAGQNVTFSVTATGTAPLSYQWFKDGSVLSGATSSAYSLTNAQAAHAGTYTVKVSNGTAPDATSSAAVLTVSAAPVAPSITTPPQSQSITAGQNVTFSVTATGTAPLSYQWFKDGSVLSGATSSAYSLTNAQAAHAGTYTVKVSNGTAPDATSSAAVLTVSAAPVAAVDFTCPPEQQTPPLVGTLTGVDDPTKYKLLVLVSSNLTIWNDKTHIMPSGRYDQGGEGIPIAADGSFTASNWQSVPLNTWELTTPYLAIYVVPTTFDASWTNYQVEGTAIPQKVLDVMICNVVKNRSNEVMSRWP